MINHTCAFYCDMSKYLTRGQPTVSFFQLPVTFSFLFIIDLVLFHDAIKMINVLNCTFLNEFNPSRSEYWVGHSAGHLLHLASGYYVCVYRGNNHKSSIFQITPVTYPAIGPMNQQPPFGWSVSKPLGQPPHCIFD